MKQIFFILTCLCGGFLWSQNVSGVVTGPDTEPVIMASVQLLQNDVVVAHTITNLEGHYSLSVNSYGSYKMVLNHWNFHRKEMNISISESSQVQDFILEAKNVELGEVVLEAQGLLAKKRGDTLSYNLGVITDGTERKLKDILHKLPGIEVNSLTGKITAQGKPIDDLLINGQRLFGDNHRLATENLPANMLSEIDLIHNYESFGAVKEIEGGNRTAINLTIKEEFFGKITGSGEVFAGYESAYLAHTKLFEFGKKTSFSVIADANNIGKESLTIFDFIELSGGIKKDIRQMGIRPKITLSNFPKFLLSEKDIAKKQTELIAIHTTAQPIQKWQLSGYAIASHANMNKNTIASREYFASNNSFVDTEKTKFQHYNWLAQLNSDYKWNSNAQLSYTFSFSKNKADRNQYTHQSRNNNEKFFFQEYKKENFLNVEQQITFIQKLTKYSLLSFNTYHQYKEKSSQLTISFQNEDDNTPLQGTLNQWGAFAKYSLKLPYQHLFSGVLGYDYHKENISYSAKRDNLSIGYTYALAGLMRKYTAFEYNVIGELRHYPKEEQALLLPQLLLKYSFKRDLHYIQGHYLRDIRLPELSELNTVGYRYDFNNFYAPTLLSLSDLNKEQKIGLTYHYQSYYHGIGVTAQTNYSFLRETISVQTSYLNNKNTINYRMADGGYAWENEANFEYRLFKWKQIMEFKAEYNQNSSYLYIDNLLCNNQNQFTQGNFILKSNFKEQPLSYTLGILVNFTENKLSPLVRIVNLWEYVPYVNISLHKGHWFGEFKHRYVMAHSDAQRHNYWDIAYSLNYQKPQSKWSYFVLAENFLNLQGRNFLRTRENLTYFEIQKSDRLRGFLGAGIKFEW